MQQSGDPLRIQVFNALEDAILNGSYKEGDSLNELRLSKRCSVDILRHSLKLWESYG